MKIHRFIIEKINLVESANRPIRISDKQMVHQMKNVLKLKPDEIIIIADGRGLEARCQIIKFCRGEAEVHLNEVSRNLFEPKKKITLYCSLLKKENFEFVIQKATEIGVSRIVPIITEKTIKLNVNTNRLKKIAREASEQSGRALVPEIIAPIDFKKAVEDAGANSVNLFFVPGAKELKKDDYFQRETIGVFIGSEGGWSEAECYLAEVARMQFVGLGSLVFRAETAAVLSVFLATKL